MAEETSLEIEEAPKSKKKLIIIGDSATIGNDTFYKNLLDYIETQGTYRSAWEYMY